MAVVVVVLAIKIITPLFLELLTLLWLVQVLQEFVCPQEIHLLLPPVLLGAVALERVAEHLPAMVAEMGALLMVAEVVLAAMLVTAVEVALALPQRKMEVVVAAVAVEIRKIVATAGLVVAVV
jgi:hypothetical protein